VKNAAARQRDHRHDHQRSAAGGALNATPVFSVRTSLTPGSTLTCRTPDVGATIALYLVDGDTAIARTARSAVRPGLSGAIGSDQLTAEDQHQDRPWG
jgi:hypothetical protein